MTRDTTLRLRRLIWLARLEFAIIRLESTVIIALTLIGAPLIHFLGRQGTVPEDLWGWVLLAGGCAQAAILVVSLTDPNAGVDRVARTIRRYFGMVGLRQQTTIDYAERAIALRARMDGIFIGRRALRGSIVETLASVDSWLMRIGQLAKQLERYGDDVDFQIDQKEALSEEIEGQLARLKASDDPILSEQLKRNVASKRQRYAMIEELERVNDIGLLQLEHAVETLGTIYTQLTIFASKGADESDTPRLAAEISREIDQVNEVISAMDRVLEPEAAV